MTRRTLWLGAIGIWVLAASLSAAAQAPAQGAAPQGQGAGGRGAPQPPPTNLQVLPKDWTRQQVVQVMQQINQGLGVTCAYCHMFVAPNDPTNDFASDVKPQKNVARAMMRMTQDLNAKIPQAVNKSADQATRVSCAMCHRGAAIPSVPPPAAPGAPGAPGPGAPSTQPPAAGRGNV